MKGLDTLTKVEVLPLNRVLKEKIIDYVRANALMPGDKLPTEAELAERIGVSRSAVREALRGLEALGMVEVQRGSGRYLKSIEFSDIIDDFAYTLVFDDDSLLDLLELRAALEMAFIAQAIPLLTPEDCNELEKIFGRIKTSIDQGKAFELEDMEFHKCLFRNIDNRLLQKLLDVFWTLFSKALPEAMKKPDQFESVIQHHGELLEAAKDRDVDRAVESLKTHFTDVKERLQKYRFKSAKSPDGAGKGGKRRTVSQSRSR